MAQPAVQPTESRLTSLVAISGFIAIAFAQVTNIVLARGNAGAIPPFSLAFFRWTIVALGLAPFVIRELRTHRRALAARAKFIVLAGFLGMFVCGAPVYMAGVSTNAINIALIMALSPIVVLIVAALGGIETIGRFQVFGVMLALSGALLIISRGDPGKLLAFRAVRGDLLVLVAMLGWSGYTLVQSRAAPELSFLARVCMFAAAGALFSLPFAIAEAIAAPARVFSTHALQIYLLAGIVPGILAYSGFAYLGARFGSVRSSLVLYLGPIASGVLAFFTLGETPLMIQVAGGGLILVGVWASLKR